MSPQLMVIMAGLPATGKSTLARGLARELAGLVIDKDTVRAALFAPYVDYSREQDELVMECIYRAALYAVRFRPVFIDGRAFSKRYQLERALEVAASLQWRVIETVCSDEAARARIEATTEHLAANRTFDLYLALKAQWEPVTVEKLVVDTGRPLEECVAECLAYLRKAIH